MELNDEVLGMTSRTNSTSLFVVVDESGASRHTLQYVGALVGKRRGFRIVLGYVLPSLPTELLEFGGAENPEKEEKLGKELKGEQKRWLSVARRKAREVFSGRSHGSAACRCTRQCDENNNHIPAGGTRPG